MFGVRANWCDSAVLEALWELAGFIQVDNESQVPLSQLFGLMSRVNVVFTVFFCDPQFAFRVDELDDFFPLTIINPGHPSEFCVL